MTTEGERPEGDYSQFTPQELKKELKLLFQMIPETSPLLRGMQGRSHEDLRNAVPQPAEDKSYTGVLTEKMLSILSFSYLSPSLQQIIALDFDFDAAFANNNLSDNKDYQLLELDSEDLGIFDPDRAKEIARNLINYRLKTELEVIEGFKQAALEYGADVNEDDALFKPTERIIKARREFAEKYGEEP